jgi:pimeloyl-ACP methyl ester carboxylesterase
VILGADDQFFSKGVAQSSKELFPSSSLDTIEKAGHYVQLARGNEFAPIILEKLQENSVTL